MSVSRILKWLSGGFETILAIPVVGASIVIGSAYAVLPIMLVLHIVTLVLTKRDKGASVGSVLGIITSCLGWIPFLGWVMHILTAVFCMVDASKKDGEVVAEQV